MVLHAHRRKVFGNKDELYMKVVIIGSGNVAESLAQAVAEAEGFELLQLFARNEERGRKVAELAKPMIKNQYGQYLMKLIERD